MLREIFVYTIVVVGIWQATKGAFQALLFYLFLAYFRPDAWLWDPSFIRSLNLSLLVGAYLLIRYPFSDGKLRPDLLSGLLVAFLAVTFASLYGTRHFDAQWVKWTDFTKSIVITILISGLAVDLSRFRMVALAIALSLGFEAAKQGWTQLVFSPGGINENPLPLLGDNNGVAVGMLMLTTLFIALARTAGSRRERWVHWFFIVGTAYRAIATYSRGAFLAAGGLIVVYVLRSDRKFRSALGTALVATALLSVLPSAFWDRMSTIQTSEDKLQDDSALSRPHFWRVATAMANQNPLLGVGYNSYNAEYDTYDFLNGRFGTRRSVHSMWFGVLAELGYTGLALFVAILVSSVISAGIVARQARRGQIPKEFFYYAVALQTAFTVCLIGGSFVPWQYTEMLWHFVGLTMALRNCALNSVPVPAAVPAAPAVPRREHTRFKPAAARGV